MNVAIGDTVEQPVMQLFARLAAPHLLDDRPHIASAFWGFRVAPAMFLVQNVAQGVIGTLIAGWCDVQAAATLQLHAWREEVQFHPPLMGMAHPEDFVLVWLQSGKGQLLESVHGDLLLTLGGSVLGRK
jgi:hypothetical protein